jgi:Protein of unknown function (DUF3892)
MARQITCINKPQRHDPYHHITHIGGSWGKTSEAQAIAEIKARTQSYFVSVNNRSVDVVVSTSPHGHEYLKTVPDGYPPNNLLNLPECR